MKRNGSVCDPLVAVPGTKMTYSIFGHTLASIVLEEAAGTPFVELLQQKIAAPLGLASLTVDAPRTRRAITASAGHIVHCASAG